VLLAVNVGNTNTVLGVFRGSELEHQWRMSTETERTADELAVMLAGLLEQAGLSFSNQITGVVLASVVPTMTTALRDMVTRYFNFPPVVVEPGTRTGLSIQTDNPREVGADRIVNALAAFHRYGGPCIVIDFGTATTYDVVSDKGDFLGGAIAPGVQTSNASLSRETARLPQVEPLERRLPDRNRNYAGLDPHSVWETGPVVPFLAPSRSLAYLQSLLAAHAITCRSSECVARQSLRAGGGYGLLISGLKVRFLRGAPT